MCGKKWGKDVHFESILLSIEDSIYKYASGIQSIYLIALRNDDQVTSDTKWDHLHKEVSEFLDRIRGSFAQAVMKLYMSLRTNFSSQEVELVDIMDSLLHSLRDLLQYEKPREFFAEALGDLEESIRFLKNFILFTMLRGLEHTQMKALLTHIESMVLNAARLAFNYWYYGHPNNGRDICQLIEKIKPVSPHVHGIYDGVLQVSKSSLSSHHPTPGSHRPMLADFVDSFLFLLWKLLFVGSRYREIFNHQMHKLYGGLTFLRTILREHQNKFDELYEKVYDLIGVVICEAGIIICHLFVGKNEELELLFLDLEKKFKLIKAEEEMQKYPLMSSSYFCQTNVLGFIDYVLEKMKSVSQYETDSVILALDKFQTVHDDLALLRSFWVDVMVQPDQNGKLQTLHSRIASVAYEIEFVLDSLVAGDAIQSLVVMLDTIAEEIKLINDAVETLYDKMQITKLQNIARTQIKLPSVREIPELNKPMVGLDDEAKKIISRLKRGTKHLDIVSIVGMPGLGKTTLAKKVNSDPSIIHHFHVRTWCCVSQVYNKKSLLLEILSGLLNNFADKHSEKNENDLAEELYRYLKGKRYLIILDDVWDTSVWNSLSSSFPNDDKGSRILLTSRHHNVASEIKPDSEPHNLRSLTNDESWELLQKNICFEDFPRALIALGKEIAQHCKGLPLMILMVAGLLSKTVQDTWKELAESLKIGTLSVTERCIKTLELSYLYLPDHLKPCFLYFGAFEEDQQIPVQELLWLWIAEGFVEKTGRECLEDVADGYLKELIQRSLVMVAKKGSRGKVKSCIIHDLLLDFCKTKGNEEHFLHCLRGNELGTFIEPSILYRLRVHFRREDFAESMQLCPRLRTLFFVADYESRYARHLYDMFYKFCPSKLIRVLDLRRIRVGWFFPREIELLVHLRYLALGIEGRRFTIPPSIDNLSNLETFLLVGWLVSVLLPDTVWNMKKLRHLCITGEGTCWEWPEENPKDPSNLENLETLSTVEFSSVQTMNEGVKKFHNNRRLKCKLKGRAAQTEDCEILALDVMSQLESLTMHSCYGIFLDFQFPQNLKKLVLSEFWLPWSEISAIERLPHLEVLKLLKNAFTGKIWDMEEGNFPKLRFLKLAGLDLDRWTDSDDHFPCLEKLVLDGCRRLEEVPSCLAYISTLEMIEVSNYRFGSAIQRIQEEQSKMRNQDLKILFHPS